MVHAANPTPSQVILSQFTAGMVKKSAKQNANDFNRALNDLECNSDDDEDQSSSDSNDEDNEEGGESGDETDEAHDVADELEIVQLEEEQEDIALMLEEVRSAKAVLEKVCVL